MLPFSDIENGMNAMAQEFFPRWLPIQIASHYGFPLADWTGARQTIAIISLGGKLDKEELKRNFRALRTPWPDVEIKDVSQHYTDRQDNAPTAETHLDLEVVGTICSEAKITIYRGANDGGQGFADAVKNAVDDDNSVISISWGHTESDDPINEQMELALAEARAKDISVCVAAGDAGSSDCRDGFHAIPAEDGRARVQYPGSSPNVLCCGGTQMMMEGDYFSEVVWNNSEMGRAATGGGVSDMFEKPEWQSDAGIEILSANEDRRNGRVIPDVSALAAGGAWDMLEDGVFELGGGTSAVAPLYASMIAIANQKRESLGKGRLGFINDKLYKLAQSSDCFNDITVGNNRPAKNYPGYDAQTGYDACTGWGSLKAAVLIDALAAL